MDDFVSVLLYLMACVLALALTFAAALAPLS